MEKVEQMERLFGLVKNHAQIALEKNNPAERQSYLASVQEDMAADLVKSGIAAEGAQAFAGKLVGLMWEFVRSYETGGAGGHMV